jgi:hypothetical protein
MQPIFYILLSVLVAIALWFVYDLLIVVFQFLGRPFAASRNTMKSKSYSVIVALIFTTIHSAIGVTFYFMADYYLNTYGGLNWLVKGVLFVVTLNFYLEKGRKAKKKPTNLYQVSIEGGDRFEVLNVVVFHLATSSQVLIVILYVIFWIWGIDIIR